MQRPLAVYVLIVFALVIFAFIRARLQKRKRAEGFFSFFNKVEIGALALLVGALILFGCLQIVLRNFFHSGLFWADPLMRHIVLWIGCLGGAYATTRIRHINIDVFSRLLPRRLKALRNVVIYFATAAAASVLGLAALKLVLDEKAYGETAFLGIGTWLLQLALPFAFFLITYRCLLSIFLGRVEAALKQTDNP
jgi:TRAP-type C4-dicarboxylate transport system permease small subunit